MMDFMISICSRDESDVANAHLDAGDTDVWMSKRGNFPPFLVLLDGHKSVNAVMGGSCAASLEDAIVDDEEVCPSDEGLSC